MKKKSSRDLIIITIIIALIFVGGILFENSYGSSKHAYSIDNKSKNGISVFFETLKELEYPVERTMKSVEDHSTKGLQVIVHNSNFSLKDEKVMNWIEEGGTLVYLYEKYYLTLDYASLEETRKYVQVYSYGDGKIITAQVNNLTNSELYYQRTRNKERDEAYQLLQIIEEQDYNKIYFNERYFYLPSESKSLWSSLSQEQKFVCFEIIIFLIAFFSYKGKRFGKPIPLYDEVERTENEYVYSAAALYKYAGCWDLATENYYRSFLRLINRSQDNWLEYWEEQQLPMFNKAKEVHDFMQEKHGKVKAKKYIHIIVVIEQLTDIFNKRRDSYWKQWKINQ